MRLIGHLVDEAQSRRFTAYLLVQGVAIRPEPDENGWALWVRDEDQVPQAREALAEFQAAPDDARYASAEAQAAEQQRAALVRQRAAQKNQVDMASRWRRSTTGPRPLTMTLAILSVLVFVMTSGGSDLASMLGDLTFCRIDTDGSFPKDGFLNIRQGEVWRLVTPIFIHFGTGHLVFNLLALFSLGSQIERAKGTPTLGLLTLSIAVVSNTLQYFASAHPMFGGLSGVLFGLVGYAWMKTRQDPGGPIRLPIDTLMFVLAFFFLCILREIAPFSNVLGQFLPHIANTAHATGLVMGIAIGWLPHQIRRWRK